MEVTAKALQGYVRLSFPYKYYKGVRTASDGSHLLLNVPEKLGVHLPTVVGGGVQSLSYRPGSIVLNLVEGARARALKVGSQFVYDIFEPVMTIAPSVKKLDPVKASPPSQALSDNVVQPKKETEVAQSPVSSPDIAIQDSVSPKEPRQSVSGGPKTATLTENSPQATLALLAAGDGDVGVAVFKRGGRVTLVFDKSIELTVDPSQSLNAFGAKHQMLGGVSVISLDWPESAPVSLVRDQRGWSISGQEVDRPKRTFLGARSTSQVEFPFDTPGHVVSILDPDTDTPLLVGTVLSTTGSNQSSHTSERAPGFSILASEYGVFIEPGSDALELKPIASGFVLSGALPPSKDTQAQQGKPIVQRFDFAAGLVEGQMQRLSTQIARAAAAPIRSRSAHRVAIAQTQISLGLGKEALSILHLTLSEDPSVSRNAEFGALLTIAALVAGQPSDSDLGSVIIDGSDDLNFWDGVQKARISRAVKDAARLYDSIPLLLSYLPPLRDRFMPWIVEAALDDGRPKAFVDLPDEEKKLDRLQFAKAMQLELSGNIPGAIVVYEEVRHSPDFRDQVRASARLAELRLADGQLTAREASAVLESQAFVWRGDDLEVQLKLRSAKLLEKAEAWRPALEALRVVQALPSVRDDGPMVTVVQHRTEEVLLAFAASSARAVTPVETVALLDDFESEITPGPATDKLKLLKAEKLLELEMPEKAIPILLSLRETTRTIIENAEIGGLLAQALSEVGRLEEVKPVLQASSGVDLPAALVARRSFVQARAEVMLNQFDAAEATLSDLHSTAADTLRVELFSSRGDWKRVTAALKDIVDRDVANEGHLAEDQQDLIVRLVSAGVEAGLSDMAKAVYAARANQMSASRSKILALLLSTPTASLTDRAGVKQDIASAKDVSAYRFSPSR